MTIRKGSHRFEGGTTPQLRRPLSVLDLLPVSPMTRKSFDYLQEGGTFGYAAETAEGQLRPEAGVDLTEAEVVAATVAVAVAEDALRSPHVPRDAQAPGPGDRGFRDR
jgi:hypothetical protein